MIAHLVYLYLLSPLHTGGSSQEGNLVGIARESHTNLPYIPSSSIRGRLRSSVVSNIDKNNENALIEARIKQVQFFGPDLNDIQDPEFIEYYEMETSRKLTQLEQGSIWVGDGSILWIPVPSLSHGVIWVSSPLLLQRWARINFVNPDINISEYSSNLGANNPIYLKDAILKGNELKKWDQWENFVPKSLHTSSIQRVLVLPDQHCQTLIQMSLWRQVKIKLNQFKTVDGGFRYEEAIPPDTLMYFPWGVTSQAYGDREKCLSDFKSLLGKIPMLQIGGQESLGRGFVEQWMPDNDLQSNKKEN